MNENSKDHEYFSSPKYRAWYNRYFNMLHNLTISRFEWVNLPPEIPPTYLEEMLFWYGQVLFFKEDVLEKYAVMKVCLGGTMDNYGVPNTRFAYSYNYQNYIDKNQSVIIWDNATNYPVADYVQMYADSLANMRLTRDINIYAQRTPITFAGTNQQRLTVKNLFKQYNDFVPFIEVKDGITNLDNLKVLNTGAPPIFDKMQILIKQELSSFCNLIGIDSIDGSKRERLVSQEAIQDADLTMINRESYLMMRQRACDTINDLFGLKVSVKYRGGVYNDNGSSDGSEVDDEKDGDNNEHVYNND